MGMEFDLEGLLNGVVDEYCSRLTDKWDRDEKELELFKEILRIFTKYCITPELDEERLKQVVSEYVISTTFSEDNVNEMNNTTFSYDADVDERSTGELCDILSTLYSLWVTMLTNQKYKPDDDLLFKILKIEHTLWERDEKSVTIAATIDGMIAGFKQFMEDNKNLTFAQLFN